MYCKPRQEITRFARSSFLRLRSGAGFVVVMVFLFTIESNAYATNVEFSIVPNKCISLRKGQTCFQRIKMQWQTDVPGQICLWQDGDSEPLKCWYNLLSGEFRYKFSAKTSTDFFLISGKTSKQEIARGTVKINWVYNSRSSGRTRWRLF